MGFGPKLPGNTTWACGPSLQWPLIMLYTVTHVAHFFMLHIFEGGVGGGWVPYGVYSRTEPICAQQAGRAAPGLLNSFSVSSYTILPCFNPLHLILVIKYTSIRKVLPSINTANTSYVHNWLLQDQPWTELPPYIFRMYWYP